MQNLLEQLTKLWAKFSPLQKAILAIVPAALIVGLVIITIVLIKAPANKMALFTDLEPMDAARVVEHLQKNNVPYELAGEGTSILVDPNVVYDLRLELAAMGLPQRHVGFELFDKQEFGLTEKGLQMKQQRALQGELASTIESMNQVDTAAVLLNIAPESSFLDIDSRSTASVMLTMNNGGGLSKAQTEGLKHLISCAVPRLSADDVSIVDSFGNPMTGTEQSADGEQLASMDAIEKQRQIRNRVEKDLEQKITQALEGPYGKGKVSPSVAVEIDFSKIKRDSETYSPVVEDQGVESHVTEQRKKETSSGADLGGVPGVTSNVPGYLGISEGESKATENSEYNLDVDYLVNKQVTQEDLPPGAIIRRSASVAVSTDMWDSATKTSVEELVANAIGADTGRGDRVFVQAFEFADTTAAVMSQTYMKQEQSRTISRIAGWLVALIIAVMAMLLLRSLVLGALPREGMGLAAAMAGGRELGAELPPGIADEFALKRLDEMAANQQEKMRQEINRMADNAPEQVLALLRTWMLEDT